MTTTHPTPTRSNRWITARRTARRTLACTVAVIGVVIAGYVPGALAVAALAHRGLLP